MEEITQEVKDIVYHIQRDSERLERIEVKRNVTQRHFYIWLNPLLFEEFTTKIELTSYIQEWMRQKYTTAPQPYYEIGIHFVGILEARQPRLPRIIFVSRALDNDEMAIVKDTLDQTQTLSDRTEYIRF